ncbi:putative secreted protein with PEP-CTERM sorting signal/choice-of-anchor A domain-containing protein [Roseiarcus fermentans]|uniref:Putative secreted protein with PEP-CTERM sorting signal/choice-of-anchor A domain-containing protein n=1 Tax=Roseiarcus fermentans TaxID=1473586 RepID=A0A366FC64_9HYPH|nr:collagen-binding domain-containing protein [Roseiarcus fermentans]RBP12274.1 putative secreted protein with PEP-CTERM sorting signal/choice-of-anchor A domain-containing protein [Roseiarcus fermentans]
MKANRRFARFLRVAPTLALASAASAAAVPASAETLTAQDILEQFNDVFTTTFTSGHDVQGRSVAGTITGGAQFYTQGYGGDAPPGSDFQAVNAVDTTAGCNGCKINNGGSLNTTGTNAASFIFNGGGSAKQNEPAFVMSDFTVPLNALESTLSGLAANNVNPTDTNQYYFDANHVYNDGIAVFSVSASTLQTAATIGVDVGSASTVVINVTGSSGFGFTPQANFTYGGSVSSQKTVAQHVIWNFEDAGSLSMDRDWSGAFLAGRAAVSNSVSIDGFLYAYSFNGSGELHDWPFAGVLPPTGVPEPSTWAMLIAGLAGAVFVGRRRPRDPDRVRPNALPGTLRLT